MEGLGSNCGRTMSISDDLNRDPAFTQKLTQLFSMRARCCVNPPGHRIGQSCGLLRKSEVLFAANLFPILQLKKKPPNSKANCCPRS